MPLGESEWEAATVDEDVLTQVYEVLEDGRPRAYRVSDFFRDAAPEPPEEFELSGALKRAVNWRGSRERSEAVVEMALELLVFRGEIEKRTVTRDGESVAYYRIP